MEKLNHSPKTKEDHQQLYNEYKYKDVIYLHNKKQYYGSITIKDAVISFHFINQDNDSSPIDYIKYSKAYFSMSLFVICKVKSKDGMKFNIITKDNRFLEFEAKTKDLYNNLVLLTSKHHLQTIITYTRNYYKEFKHLINIDGWYIYDIYNEAKRQGVDMTSFRISEINKDFTTCETYPMNFILPIDLEDRRVFKIAELRTKGRLPIMTYYHKENKWSLWRSSQRKMKIKPSKSERKYFNGMNKLGKGIKIYDARPFFNALINSFKGNAIEDISHYDNCTRIFCDMENIHLVRKAHEEQSIIMIKKLPQAHCNLWYEYIGLILKSSCDIVADMKKNITVLVHCSDGWDRTTQLCATSQLMIDKYYRTIEGFCVLIQKDWVSYGHQFCKRNGLLKGDDSEASPIFIQWLDAVYQIMKQSSFSFEFNTNLLLFLTDELYFNRYGTFLFDSEKERLEHQAKEETMSIWSAILSKKDMFINPYYISGAEVKKVKYDIKSMSVWREYYCKYDQQKDYDVVEMKGVFSRHMTYELNLSKRRQRDIYDEVNEDKERDVNDNVIRNNNTITNQRKHNKDLNIMNNDNDDDDKCKKNIEGDK